MPVRKERQLMRRLKYIYTAIFFGMFFLLALFLFREHSVRQLNYQLQSLNYARQDFDAGVLHYLLADNQTGLWQGRIGNQLFEQTINNLNGLTKQRRNSVLAQSVLKVTQQLQAVLAVSETTNPENHHQIFEVRIAMEALHSEFQAVLLKELREMRYWLWGLVIAAAALILGLFGSLLRTEVKRERFHRQLYATQQQLSLITENIDEVFWLQDVDNNRVLYVSNAFETIWQLPRECLVTNPDAWFDRVHHEDQPRVQAELAQADSQPLETEYRIIFKDGQIKWIRDRLFPVNTVNADGETKRYLVAIASDISATKKLNQQLLVAQKMDSLGKLTGGIAHDFNNLLTVIMGNAQLLIEQMAPDSPLVKVAALITKASERGASLNKQLLAFASKQHLKPERVDITGFLHEILLLLRRTLGENISLQFNETALRPCCYVDAGQLQNAIINLCINAKDAMPAGGSIIFSLSLREEENYAQLEIADSGQGIPEEVLPHIFEPFFTTKAAQKGTGLGLSMVYGFIKQSGGDIQVSSSLNLGTTFRLLLPLCSQQPFMPESALAATETKYRLLLVEDDAMVRESVLHMLKDSGYQVNSAEQGAEGWQKLLAQGDYDLLLTDVVMSGELNGIELADRARQAFPELKILLMSGYVGKLNEKSISFASYAFLAKPFSKSQLLQALAHLN